MTVLSFSCNKKSIHDIEISTLHHSLSYNPECIVHSALRNLYIKTSIFGTKSIALGKPPFVLTCRQAV